MHKTHVRTAADLPQHCCEARPTAGTHRSNTATTLPQADNLCNSAAFSAPGSSPQVPAPNEGPYLAETTINFDYPKKSVKKRNQKEKLKAQLK